MIRSLHSLLFTCALGLALGSTGSAQIGGPKLPEVDWTQNLGAELPLETRFLDLENRSVSMGELMGERPAILALVYFECPMLCDLVMNGLISSMRSLSFDAGDEFDVFVLSINPEETAELARSQSDGYLKRYGREGTEGAWHFLRGDKPAIDAVASSVGYKYTYVRETGEFAHPAGITILTPEGRVARILYGNEFSSRDLKFSLMEAAGGTIGSPMDKIILRCFHYDPSRGEYGFAIMRTLQISGSALVAFMVFIIVRMIRRGNPILTPDAGGAGQS